MKMPRLPNGWVWDLDRTSDVVNVSIRKLGSWQYANDVLVANPRWFRLHLWRLRLVALWNALVAFPFHQAFANTRERLATSSQKRHEARQEARQAFARSANGYYDHTGKKIARPIEPLADWELELLGASNTST